MRKSRILFLLLSFFLVSKDAIAKNSSPDEVTELRNILDSQSKILAEAVQDIATLRSEILSLKGTLEENRHFISSGTENNEKLLKDYDLRITAMEEKLSLIESQFQESLSTDTENTPRKTGAASSGEDDLYKRALAEINTQNYKGAIPILDQFLKKYPKSALADNAQYWKGESLYGLKQFPEAILEFQKVVKKYPKSDKIAASILKQGYCFYESKQYADAKIFLQKVTVDYPKTQEAIKAREKISQIDRMLSKEAATPTP